MARTLRTGHVIAIALAVVVLALVGLWAFGYGLISGDCDLAIPLTPEPSPEGMWGVRVADGVPARFRPGELHIFVIRHGDPSEVVVTEWLDTAIAAGNVTFHDGNQIGFLDAGDRLGVPPYDPSTRLGLELRDVHMEVVGSTGRCA